MQQPSENNHYSVPSSFPNNKNQTPLPHIPLTNPTPTIERDAQGRRLIKIGNESFTLVNCVNWEEAQAIEQQTGVHFKFQAGDLSAKPVLGQGSFGKVA